MSLEPPVPNTDINGFKPELSGDRSEDQETLSESLLTPDAPQPPIHKRYGRFLLGLGVFAALSGGILLVAHQISPANSMGGHDGHDMSGMSHDDMMRVDGAFNPIPVTVEMIQAGEFEAGVSYTGSIMPYQEVIVYPRISGQLTNYSVYPGDRIEAGQVLAQLNATELSTELAGARAEAYAMQTSLQASHVEIAEQAQEIARVQAELDYLQQRESRFETLAAEG